MPYLTGGTIPTADFICRRLVIPDDLALIIAVNGAIEELTFAYNWEQHGTATPQETAAAMREMFWKFRMDQPCMTATLILSAGLMQPDGTLLCDGSSHLRVDYPALYAEIDTSYHVDADNFLVPNPPSYSGLNWYIVT